MWQREPSPSSDTSKDVSIKGPQAGSTNSTAGGKAVVATGTGSTGMAILVMIIGHGLSQLDFKKPSSPIPAQNYANRSPLSPGPGFGMFGHRDRDGDEILATGNSFDVVKWKDNRIVVKRKQTAIIDDAAGENNDINSTQQLLEIAWRSDGLVLLQPLSADIDPNDIPSVDTKFPTVEGNLEIYRDNFIWSMFKDLNPDLWQKLEQWGATPNAEFDKTYKASDGA